MPKLLSAEPQLFVTDFARALTFWSDKLAFAVAYTYGEPPFYGQVARDGARLNLRAVDALPHDAILCAREDYLAASIAVDDVDALFRAYQHAGVSFHQELRSEPWGARTFIVRDADGNLLLFSGPTT